MRRSETRKNEIAAEIPKACQLLQKVHANTGQWDIIKSYFHETKNEREQGGRHHGKDHSCGGGRSEYFRASAPVSGKGRLHRQHCRRRRKGRGALQKAQARSGAAGPDAAGFGRLGRAARHPAGRQDARHHAHCQGRDHRQGRGAQAGRGRLYHQALRDEGGARAH